MSHIKWGDQLDGLKASHDVGVYAVHMLVHIMARGDGGTVIVAVGQPPLLWLCGCVSGIHCVAKI